MKKIEMTPNDFFKEHTKLVKLLTREAKLLNNEAEKQRKEAGKWRAKLYKR